MSVATAPPGEGIEAVRFRTDLTVTRQVQGGEVSYIVKDPVTSKYYRFREAEHAIFSRLDGQTPLPEVLRQVQSRFPHLGLAARDVAAFIASLKRVDLLERSQAEKSLMLLEKLRDQRQARIKSQASSLSRMLYLHYHLVDPNALFDRMLPRIRWLWSRPFVIFSLVLFGFAGYLNLRSLGEIVAGLAALYTFTGLTPWDYALIWLLSLGAIVLHEFGHGLTCKRFGGQVHDLGVMLLFFNPAMYCNVSDAYLFDNRRHKLYVTAAGGFVELWLWAVASVIWSATLPGTGLHEFAFKLIVVSGISTLAFNFNPLMKLDGYYALVDVLGVANLRDRSFEWLGTWIKRNVFRMAVPPMPVEGRLARIYAIYGTLASAYTAAMLLVMFFLFKNLILGALHLAGLPILLLLVYIIYGPIARKAWQFLVAFAATRRDLLENPQLRALALLGGVVLVVALFAGRAPAVVVEPFSLEPVAKLAVRPVVGGRVVRVAVSEGQVVRRGDVVAVLADPDVDAARGDLERRRRQEEVAIARARYEGNLPAIASSEARLKELDAGLAEAQRDVAALTLRAPLSGVVTTSRPRDRVGDRLGPSDELVEIADFSRLRAVVSVSENDVGDIRVGRPASLAFNAFPGRSLSGAVEAMSPFGEKAPAGGQAPAASGRQTMRFRVTVLIPDPGGSLKPGMTGQAKIYGESRPLWRLLLHWAGKTFNPDFW